LNGLEFAHLEDVIDGKKLKWLSRDGCRLDHIEIHALTLPQFHRARVDVGPSPTRAIPGATRALAEASYV
jgi:hypothetical protein